MDSADSWIGFFAWAPALFLVHGAAMVFDEAWFHCRRGLPTWERRGHPADTLSVILCYVLALFLPPGGNLRIYIAAAVFSTLLVTKDEWVHARVCGGTESWLHALLFVMHPVLLFLAGAWWQAAPFAGGDPTHAAFGVFLAIQACAAGLFLFWQILYWNGPWAPPLPAAR